MVLFCSGTWTLFHAYTWKARGGKRSNKTSTQMSAGTQGNRDDRSDAENIQWSGVELGCTEACRCTTANNEVKYYFFDLIKGFFTYIWHNRTGKRKYTFTEGRWLQFFTAHHYTYSSLAVSAQWTPVIYILSRRMLCSGSCYTVGKHT